MCGIVGMLAYESDFNDIASYLSWALVELEHRGKEASGIITNQGLYKDLGTPEKVFNEELLACLGGNIGLGHVLYTTSGKSSSDEEKERLRKRAQPFVASLGGDKNKKVAFVFNGNLVNWLELREECQKRGYDKEILNDTGVIAALLELAESSVLEDALREEILPKLKYSFSIIFYPVYERKLYAVRDPYGFMPLVYGVRRGEWAVFSSEDCVFSEGALDCQYWGEVYPGSIVIAESDPVNFKLKYWSSPKHPKHRKCIFHAIYFNRPDSTFSGKLVKIIQEKAGEILAELHPVDGVDVICPVSDSGLAAALGYAKLMTQKTGRWLFDSFLIFRPHVVGRTFMEPHQHLREKGVGRKHRIISELVTDKRIVVVDDSLVRGTTMKRLVSRLFKGGAKEVHVRIASPPIIEPCVYGIDIPTREELVWNCCGGDKEKIRAYIGATSLEYLDDIEFNIRAVLETPNRYSNDLNIDSFCTQCFSGVSAVD